MASHRRSPNHRLRLLVTEARLTHEALARHVNRLAALRGQPTRYDRTSVAHWLAGTRPRSFTVELLCHALSERLGRPVTPFDAGFQTTPAHGGSAAPDAVARLGDLAGAETDPRLRAAARAVPFRPGAPLPAGPADRAAADGPHEPADLALEIRSMRDTAAFCAFHLDAFGGGYTRTVLAGYLSDVVTPWLRRRGEETGHRVLFAGAAQLAHLLAQSAADMGAEGQAQQAHEISLALAAHAGDRRLYAIGLRALSGQALRLGAPASALRLAETAAETVPRTASPGTHAYVLTQCALGQAMSGLPRTAVRTLLRAERWLERADSVAGPFTHYAHADFAYQQAQVLRALGESAPALRAYELSLREREAHRNRTRVLTLAGTAELLLAQGRLDEACALWHRCLDEAPRVHSQQVTQRLAGIRQELRPYRRSPAVAELWARVISGAERSTGADGGRSGRPQWSHDRPSDDGRRTGSPA
ncbi:hypothetical protein [Streptomyces panaciradicis]|uniref:hypothetical protein n=1 Tax=Streptomyces panaciradicis TaxID=1470261 RepID=UPI00201CD634|nr:hypothetical protein [Streptomyces panaciradicis]MCL6671540.1 hypothetical protein [Streptomyces panaciradicis]